MLHVCSLVSLVFQCCMLAKITRLLRSKQLEKVDKPTACSSLMARFGLSLSAYLHTKRIVPHSFAIDLALSLLNRYPRATGSGLGTRLARLRSEGRKHYKMRSLLRGIFLERAPVQSYERRSG